VSPGALQWAALCAAFWTAVLLYRCGPPAGLQPARFVAGLALGAGLAHLGWVLLHAAPIARHPQAIWNPSLGYCVLFFPVGPLLFSPGARAFAALPLALAVARAGCLVAGCCRGPQGEATPLAEIAALVALHVLVRHLPERAVLPAVLAGFGAIRLALEPWRAPPPLGAPALAPAWIAAAWLAASGAWLALASPTPRRVGSRAGGNRAHPSRNRAQRVEGERRSAS
jgi:hypothetical protein